MNTTKLAATFTVIVLLSITITSNFAVSQTMPFSAPALDWQKTYPGNDAAWITQTVDGGLVFYYPGINAFWRNYFDPATLTKIDSAGNVQWVKNFTFPFPEAFTETTDGGFAYLTFNESSNIITLNKLDSNAAPLWNRTFSNFAGTRLFAPTSDTGFLLAVHNDSGYINTVNIRSLVFFKIDSHGDILWTQTFTSLNASYAFRAIIQTTDGSYTLAGGYNNDFSLVKISATGTLQWTKTYGGVNDDEAYSLVQTSDGNTVVAGSSSSYGAGGLDAFLIKTDEAGNLLWAKSYGGFGSAMYKQYISFTGQTKYLTVNSTGALDDQANIVIQTSDGGLAFAGTTEYDSMGYYLIWLVKTDLNGVAQWNQTYTSNFSYWVSYAVNSLIQTNDTSFVLAGHSEGQEYHNINNELALLIKTKPSTPLPSTSPPLSPPDLAFTPITIQKDGPITPSTAPITREGNMYKLNSDINSPLIVQANNVVIDGRGHLLSGNGSINNLFIQLSPSGVNLTSVSGVTVKNFNLQNFKSAILLQNASNNIVVSCSFSRNTEGITCINTANNTLTRNTFTNYPQLGIHLIACRNDQIANNHLENQITLDQSNGIIITQNYISNNGGTGLLLQSSNNTLVVANWFDNTFFGTSIHDSIGVVIASNNYTKGNLAISQSGIENNQFFMNNFINITYLPSIFPPTDFYGNPVPLYTLNAWDNGTLGNYWSNYPNQYPTAQVTDAGTWNIPYIISDNNTDYHPLVDPVSAVTAQAVANTLIAAYTPSPNPSSTSTASSPAVTINQNNSTPSGSNSPSSSSFTLNAETILIATGIVTALVVLITVIILKKKRSTSQAG